MIGSRPYWSMVGDHAPVNEDVSDHVLLAWKETISKYNWAKKVVKSRREIF